MIGPGVSVTGLQNLAELERQTRWVADLRSRSAPKCRPATLRALTWNIVRDNLKRLGLRPVTQTPITGNTSPQNSQNKAKVLSPAGI